MHGRPGNHHGGRRIHHRRRRRRIRHGSGRAYRGLRNPGRRGQHHGRGRRGHHVHGRLLVNHRRRPRAGSRVQQPRHHGRRRNPGQHLAGHGPLTVARRRTRQRRAQRQGHGQGRHRDPCLHRDSFLLATGRPTPAVALVFSRCWSMVPAPCIPKLLVGSGTGRGDRTGPAGQEHGVAAGDDRAPRVERTRRLRDHPPLRDAPAPVLGHAGSLETSRTGVMPGRGLRFGLVHRRPIGPNMALSTFPALG